MIYFVMLPFISFGVWYGIKYFMRSMQNMDRVDGFVFNPTISTPFVFLFILWAIAELVAPFLN